MGIVEHNTASPLIGFIDELVRAKDTRWGMVRVKKTHLKTMTSEAFLLAVRPALQEADEAHVFFVDSKRIYIAWCGSHKSVYKQLRSIIGTNLLQSGVNVEPAITAAYIDPATKGEILKAALKAEGDVAERLFEGSEDIAASHIMYADDEDPSENPGTRAPLTATSTQSDMFHEVCAQKPYRKQLQILVAEDQVFSQKLLCEILRGARSRNNNETPLIDTVQGIHDAWKVFLKKAPDLAFVDLGLVDGSGHTLARAMKELDPASWVVIVTANNYEEEMGVARQNHVDGFIAKPYNKKQILDCVERYVSSLRAHSRSSFRGAAGQSR